MPYIWIPARIVYDDQIDRVVAFETIDSFTMSVELSYSSSAVQPVVTRTPTYVIVEHENWLVGRLVYRPIIQNDRAVLL